MQHPNTLLLCPARVHHQIDPSCCQCFGTPQSQPLAAGTNQSAFARNSQIHGVLPQIHFQFRLSLHRDLRIDHPRLPENLRYLVPLQPHFRVTTVDALTHRPHISVWLPLTQGSQVLIEHGHIQSVLAYSASDFGVHVGANMGDTLGVLDDLILDDTYQLKQGARPQRLALLAQLGGDLQIGKATELGTPNAALHLDCVLSLMSPDGSITEALVLVEVDTDGMISAIFMLPLAPMQAQIDYVLVRSERDDVRKKLAQIASVSFSRGTHITT